MTPDHVEWRVGRRWASRRFDWRWRRHGRIASDSLVEAGGGLPDVGGVDSVPGLLLAAAAVAALLVVIPLLFFGVELIVFGVLAAGGLTAASSRGPRGSSRRARMTHSRPIVNWSGVSVGGEGPGSSSSKWPRTWPRGVSRHNTNCLSDAATVRLLSGASSLPRGCLPDEAALAPRRLNLCALPCRARANSSPDLSGLQGTRRRH